MQNAIRRIPKVMLLLVLASGTAFCMAPASKADGLPIFWNHLTCSKTTLRLTAEQEQAARNASELELTEAQRKQLMEEVDYAPRKVDVITPKAAEGTCCCEMVNVALLSEPGVIEVPHFLLACNKHEYDPYGEKAGGKCAWGYIDKTGNWVIRPQYLQAFDFRAGYGKVNVGKYTMDGDYRFVDSKGNFVNEKALPKWIGKYADSFHEGVATSYVGKKFCFVDQNGNKIMENSFDRTSRESGFYEGLAAVKIGEKWGFVDKSGKFVIGAQYKEARQFHDGLAAVSSPKKDYGYTWAFIDHTGKQVGPILDEASDFQDGIAVVEFKANDARLVGLLGSNGEVKTLDAVQCDDALSEGVVGYTNDGLAGFMDKSGKVVIPARFDAVGRFSDGLAPVILHDAAKEQGSKKSPAGDKFVGFIDHSGKLQIPAKFQLSGWSIPFLGEKTFDFKNGLSVMQATDGKFGMIDKKGRWVILPRFVELGQFYDGLAAARVKVGEAECKLNSAIMTLGQKSGSAMGEASPDDSPARYARRLMPAWILISTITTAIFLFRSKAMPVIKVLLGSALLLSIPSLFAITYSKICDLAGFVPEGWGAVFALWAGVIFPLALVVIFRVLFKKLWTKAKI